MLIQIAWVLVELLVVYMFVATLRRQSTRLSKTIPCPVEWPDCHPGGCRVCGGKGYTDK